MSDQRAVQTRHKIINTFLTLLTTKSVLSISVSELSTMTNINRGTFYLHYKDIFDLYNQVMEMVLLDLKNDLDRTYPRGSEIDFKTLTEHVINYINKEQAFFLTLLRSENGATFIEKIKRVFIEKVYASNNTADMVDVIYNVNGIIGVLIFWQTDSDDISTKEITDRLTTILETIE